MKAIINWSLSLPITSKKDSVEQEVHTIWLKSDFSGIHLCGIKSGDALLQHAQLYGEDIGDLA